MAKAKRQPRGLGRSAAAEPEAATENARHNPIARPGKETSTNENKATDQDQDMTDATESQEQETASLALQGEAGDEMAELRQTYEAAQKQFGENTELIGNQNYR